MATNTRRSSKAGLPPGTPVYVGERKNAGVSIELFAFDAAALHEERIAPSRIAAARDTQGVAWFNIDGVHDLPLLEQIGTVLGLHPLTLEDIVNTEQRPKIEDYESYLFIVLKMLRPAPDGSGIITEQASLVLGDRFVASFQEGVEGDVFDPVRERLRGAQGRIRTAGADFLCYALIDAVVDTYFVILEDVGEQIEDVEEQLLRGPTTPLLQRIHQLKRELIFLRKSVWPLREVIATLLRRESPLITQQTAVFLRDVHDHTVQIIDAVETSRDMLSGLLDLYMSSMSNRMNEIMKVLTIIATIFIPLTFVAGVYGMNFRYMPELEWRWGYPFAWIMMSAIGVVLMIYFKRKRWI